VYRTRDRTNTPLQALVTLNDPVYVEAAQSLARTMDQSGNTPTEKLKLVLRHAFLVLHRTRNWTAWSHSLMRKSESITPRIWNLPARWPLIQSDQFLKNSNLADLAALTVAGNIMLNLDEMMMKR
jgi:hypothetical protein